MVNLDQQSKGNWPENYGDAEWFIESRFGLFIHWGLYSSAARHEWIMNYEQIPVEEYEKYFKFFDPDLYNPREWARMAKQAGMKYFVITTKHHEGFALWDSKYTDYKVTNTPIGRDILLEMVEAFREEGLKVGFYYSLIDWHHPEFPIDGLHPQRGDQAFIAAEKDRDMEKYVKYMHNQVEELLTNYGKIDYMWFDFSYPYEDWDWAKGKGKADWKSEELEEMILQLQPHIILNDRLDLNRGVTTPEQYQPNEPIKKDGQSVIWEACQTLNGSWGYDRDNLDWKPADLLIKMLIDTVSKDGNLLLNIGPDARGQIDERSVCRLNEIGSWMSVHSRSIYGAKSSEFTASSDCRYTQKGKRLYVHLFSWPFKHLHLEDLAGKVEYAQFLHDASEIKYKEHDPHETMTHMTAEIKSGSITLELPVQKPNVIIPVIEIFLK